MKPFTKIVLKGSPVVKKEEYENWGDDKYHNQNQIVQFCESLGAKKFGECIYHLTTTDSAATAYTGSYQGAHYFLSKKTKFRLYYTL